LAPGHLGHAFYGSDGAAATEIALKMAFHYWKNRGRSEKTHYLSLAGSYHGETLGALAVTDVRIFRDTYAPLLKPQPDTVPYARCARDAAARRKAKSGARRSAVPCRRSARSSPYARQSRHGLAAFIVEPRWCRVWPLENGDSTTRTTSCSQR
jgi:adenosylmethionine-8-amino-7-oxononanoate aminotransferase